MQAHQGIGRLNRNDDFVTEFDRFVLLEMHRLEVAQADTMQCLGYVFEASELSHV